MKPSDQLLLADGTLHCGMYPTGKVAISRRLAIPGFPSMTILLASSVRMLVHCVVKYSRPPDLTSSSNVSLQFAWITGPTTDPSSNKQVPQIMSHQKSCQYPSINYLVCSPLSSVTFPIPFNFPVEQDSRKKDETSNSGML